MPKTFALSWNRPAYWAERLNRPMERAVSIYRAQRASDVQVAADHINELDPTFQCRVEEFL